MNGLFAYKKIEMHVCSIFNSTYVSGERWDARTQGSIFWEGTLCYHIKKIPPTQYNISDFWYKYIIA